jgi:hypothetical protein
MLRIVVMTVVLGGWLFGGLQQDFEWLQNTEQKYSNYASNPKDIYLKEYNRDGKRFVQLKEMHKSEIAVNHQLKQQFQRTIARMKKFVKIFNDRLSDTKRMYQEAFQYAIDELKRTEKQKNTNALVSSQQAFKQAQTIYHQRITKLISDPKTLDSIRKDWSRYETRYAKTELMLNKEKLNKVKKPQEKYTGEDKEKFRKLILDAWHTAYPDDKVLDIIFHMKDFRHTKNKKWNDATHQWVYRDTEVLAATVAVKTSEQIVTLYYAYFNRDNITGKCSVGVKSKGPQYVVRKMLMKNYR